MSWTEWTDTSFRGLDLRQLQVDEAFLNVSNAASKKFCLYSLAEDCVKCPFRKLRVIAPEAETIIKLDVARNLNLRLFDIPNDGHCTDYVFPNETSSGLRWSAQPEFGEFGVYDLRIKLSQAIMFETAKQPVFIYSCEFVSSAFKLKV